MDAVASEQPALSATTQDAIVAVEDLQVRFSTLLGVSQALDSASIRIARGKVLGIVGESGCGKSMLGLSILQIVPHPGRIVSGHICYKETPASEPVDLLQYGRQSPEMRAIRGNKISMIFQEPMTSLNPCYTIGNQIREAIVLHSRSQREVDEHVLEVLRRVEMPNPRQAAASYPHQLSGGMRQRAMIAMALSCQPLLLIADEPTTALDVTTEAQILSLIRSLQAETGMSVMYITHNMGVIAQMCDEVAVMYLGKVVEQAGVEDLFSSPRHPYTISLLRSVPRLGSGRRRWLESIKGSIPDPYTRIAGCAFHPRCPVQLPGLCAQEMPRIARPDKASDHQVRCHLYR